MKEKKYVVPSDDNYVQSIKAKSHPSVGAEKGKGRREDERRRNEIWMENRETKGEGKRK